MKKRFFLLAFLMAALAFPALTVSAAGGQAYNVMTNPGADMATEMNISWHSDVAVSFVQYTKVSDTNWQNANLVLGQATEFSVPDSQQFSGKTVLSSGFTARYHCKATLTGLEPNTEYKYRVGQDPAGSQDVYYFKTASGAGPFSFLFFTDPQYVNDSGASIFNNLVQKARTIDPDIRFSVVSGDFVDRGGKIEQWDILFRQSSLRQMPFAVTPGNHEYYDASSTPVFFNNTYYNGFYNNPANGATSVLGSSYYFRYNNVLFVSIDSEAAVTAAQKGAQKTWFENGMKSNHAQYIVVFMHRSFYGGIYGSVSAGLRADWQGLFDKYGVDLVLTGHDHIYRRTTRIYEGIAATDPNKGTTYMSGGSAGAKFYDLQYEDGKDKFRDLFECEFARQSSVSIFQVGIDSIKLITINSSGQYLDEVTLAAKRSPSPASNFTKESYLDSVRVTLDDKDPTKAVFYWGNQWYGHVNSARLISADGTIYGHKYLDTNRLGNYVNITGLEPNRTYDFTLQVEFKDGTTAERELSLLTKLSYGRIENVELDVNGEAPVLNWFALLQNDQIDKFRVRVNDKLVAEPAITESSCALPALAPYRENTITFEAIDIYGDVVFTETLTYGEDVEFSITFTEERIELQPGGTANTVLTITPQADFAITYKSSDESVATIDAGGKITAVGVGEAVITAKISDQLDVTCAITVTVTAAEEPGKTSKKGCFGGLTAVAGLGCLGIAALFHRRRRHKANREN